MVDMEVYPSQTTSRKIQGSSTTDSNANFHRPQTNYGPPQQGGYAYGYGYYGYYGYPLPPPPQGPYGYYQVSWRRYNSRNLQLIIAQPPPQQYGGYNSVLANNSLYSRPGMMNPSESTCKSSSFDLLRFTLDPLK